MKRTLVIIVLLLVIFTVVTCNFSNIGKVGETGFEKLANKTPKEIYANSIAYIKGLTNYEIVMKGSYKYTYYEFDETGAPVGDPIVQEESQTSVYKGTDNTFSYTYSGDGYEEHLIYDGTTVYQQLNGVKEKKNLSYDEFIAEFGKFVENGILLEISESNFTDKKFIPEGDLFVLKLTITPEEYATVVGGTVEKPVDYKVYFDANGTIKKFERSLEYYYYENGLMQDKMVASFENIGKTAKATAPANVDSYAVRPLASEIDKTSVDNLDAFETADKETDYALITFKVEPKVDESEAEAETETQTDTQTETENETETETETESFEPFEGSILIRLYPKVAPQTVANFQRLLGTATYKGLGVSSIIQDFALQISEPLDAETDTTENKFDYVFGEFAANAFTNNLSHKRGVVSMLRGEDPNSATYEFFICVDDAENLDGYYASFGYVVYGLDFLDKIAAIETDEKDVPKATITITDTRFLTPKAQ